MPRYGRTDGAISCRRRARDGFAARLSVRPPIRSVLDNGPFYAHFFQSSGSSVFFSKSEQNGVSLSRL